MPSILKRCSRKLSVKDEPLVATVAVALVLSQSRRALSRPLPLPRHHQHSPVLEGPPNTGFRRGSSPQSPSVASRLSSWRRAASTLDAWPNILGHHQHPLNRDLLSSSFLFMHIASPSSALGLLSVSLVISELYSILALPSFELPAPPKLLAAFGVTS